MCLFCCNFFCIVVPSLQVRLRLRLALELFQGRVVMDTCMDDNEFHHVCEVDNEGTASGFGGAELLPDISATELLIEE